MDSLIEQLTRSFMRFPGIGPRQAKRFVYYLLHSPRAEVENLMREMRELKANATQCAACQRFSVSSSNANPLCQLCADSRRDTSLLMLVEKDIDLENIEKSGTYRGYYFVLGGLVPVLDKNPVQFFRAPELLNLLKTKTALKEIIVAVSANPEGDYMVDFLKKYIPDSLSPKPSPLISTLGRGLSTGTELEYSDPETLKNALKHRE